MDPCQDMLCTTLLFRCSCMLELMVFWFGGRGFGSPVLRQTESPTAGSLADAKTSSYIIIYYIRQRYEFIAFNHRTPSITAPCLALETQICSVS